VPAVHVAPAALQSRRKLVVDIATTFGARFVGLPLALVSSILLARSLQPSGRGVYATVTTVGDLSLVLGTMGISTAAVYYLARETDALERTRSTVLGVCALIGVAISAALAAAAAIAAFALHAPAAGWALVAVAPIGMVSLGRAALDSFFRAEHLIGTINVAAVISSASFLAFIGVAVLGRGLSPAIAVALRVGSVAAGIVVLAVAARSFRLTIPRPRLHAPTVRVLLAYGLPYAAYSIAQNFSNRLDYFLVRLFNDASAVGVYSISVTQGELLWILPTAVGFVLFPRVAALVGTDAERAAAETAFSLRWGALVTACGAIVLALIATPLTRIMYGNAYLPAVTPLRILLVGIVASSFVQLLSSLLLGSGRLRLLILTTSVGLAINVSLNLVLIPHYGINGAACSSAVSYSVVGLLLTMVARRVVPELRRQRILPLPRVIAADIQRLRAGVARGLR
jgi:O-antigen/teichoic acid export membrane protein